MLVTWNIITIVIPRQALFGKFHGRAHFARCESDALLGRFQLKICENLPKSTSPLQGRASDARQ
jgi:hypothetical protein